MYIPKYIKYCVIGKPEWKHYQVITPSKQPLKFQKQSQTPFSQSLTPCKMTSSDFHSFFVLSHDSSLPVQQDSLFLATSSYLKTNCIYLISSNTIIFFSYHIIFVLNLLQHFLRLLMLVVKFNYKYASLNHKYSFFPFQIYTLKYGIQK